MRGTPGLLGWGAGAAKDPGSLSRGISLDLGTLIMSLGVYKASCLPLFRPLQ